MRLTGLLATVFLSFAAAVSLADDVDLDKLSKQLESGSLQEKTRAARILGEIGPAAAATSPSLVKSLQSENAGLRYEAANSLGVINGDPKIVVPALAKLLGDQVPLLRFTSIEALRKYGPRAKDAIPQLKGQLNDNEQMLAVCAARAVVEIEAGKGPDVSVAQGVLLNGLKSDRHDISVEAAHGLAVIGAPAVPAIQALIGEKNVQTSVNACDALAAIGPGADMAVEQLANAAKSQQLALRWHAISALGDIGPTAKSAAPVLISSLGDADPQVRFSAEQSLIKMGKAVVPALMEGLKNEKLHAVVSPVVAAIGPDASAAVPALAAMIRSKDPEIRREAILALAAIGPDARSTVPEMIKLLEDPQSTNRPAAAYALGRLGAKEAVPALKKALVEKEIPVLHLAAAWALLQIDPSNDQYATEALPLLTSALENEMPQIRREAARTLARLGAKAKSSVAALQKRLSDQDPQVRREVLIALGEIGSDGQTLVPDLVKIIDEGEPSLHSIACYALGRLGAASKSAVPVLKKSLSSPDPYEKTVAAWALVQISPDAETATATIPILVNAAGRAPNPEIRVEAVQALGKIGSNSSLAKDAVNSAMKDPDASVRKAAEQVQKQLK